MTTDVWGVSLSPGNEQLEFWGSHAADTPGSRNTIGIKNEAVDKLIELIVTASTREDLVIRCRALDRVLQWHHYLVPHYHSGTYRVAYWNRFGMPDKRPDPLYGYGLGAWWVDPAKDDALAGRKDAEQPTEQAAVEQQPAATTAPAGQETQPAEQQAVQQSQGAAAPQPPAGAAAADRGQSPLIYAGGAIAVFVVAFFLGRRGRKRS
jgi:microcin C transport system substrate-binding protein